MDLYIQLTTLEPPSFDLASNAFVMIGESIGWPGNKVMFYLLILLSILIEVCILFSAPGTYIEESEPNVLSVKRSFKEPEDPVMNKPEEVEKEINPNKISKLAYLLKEDEDSESKPGFTSIRTRAPHKPVLDKIDRFKIFVHILFDNSMNAHIRSIDDIEVGREYADTIRTAYEKADVVLRKGYEEQLKSELKVMWNWLCRTKGPTGYFLIEKRNNFWFPNYTAELVINQFVKITTEKD